MVERVNDEGRKRRLPVAAFEFLSVSILRNGVVIKCKLFLAVLRFGLLGLRSFAQAGGLDRNFGALRRKAILSFRFAALRPSAEWKAPSAGRFMAQLKLGPSEGCVTGQGKP
jgi:hypothetical protein